MIDPKQRHKIEWTNVADGNGGFKKGETWNPQVGCKEISSACRSCYAAKLAHRGMSPQHKGLTVLRKDGPHWNGEINRVPGMLSQPLKWREPRGVFVGSMTDLFIKVDTDEDCEFIAAIFGVMIACPQHTFMLLTKRPENAARWFAWLDRQCEESTFDQVELCVQAAGEALLDAGFDKKAEQLFDRHGWARDGDYYGGFEAMEHEDLPGIERRKRRAQRDTEGWDGEQWPARNIWVGVTAEDQQRADERIPVLLDLPASVRYVSYEPACGPLDLSRWIGPHEHCTACDRPSDAQDGDTCPHCGAIDHLMRTWGDAADDEPRLHQVIAGGESGAGARPSHPDWFRLARDQCVEAGVAFFFKQWGEWAPEVGANRGPKMLMSSTGETADAGRYGRECVLPVDKLIINGKPALEGQPGRVVLARYGKSENGRELDGRTWDGFPGLAPSTREIAEALAQAPTDREMPPS